MSSRSDRTEVMGQRQERAERAARVVAMLERWATQDVVLEPTWDIDDMERLRLTHVEAEMDDTSGR